MAQRKQELVEMLGKVSARDADLVPILDNLPDSSLLLTVDYESREALVVALRKMDAMQSAAGAGAGTATAGYRDRTADIVKGILQAMGQLDQLPEDAAELDALLTERARYKVPIHEAVRRHLRFELLEEELQLLEAVPGHRITIKFSYLLMDAPYDYGACDRSTAAVMMQQLLSTVLPLLGRNSCLQVLPRIWSSCSGCGAGSVSSDIGAGLRPACVVVCHSCTVMIGEDKEEGKLQQAILSVRSYARAGLPAAQYGAVPGIPAYAAAGTELQFLFIKRDGTVRPAGPLLNLHKPSDRLAALCAVIQLYRVIVAIVGAMPQFADRLPLPLWVEDRRDEAFCGGVTLTPTGAIKTIGHFQAFAEAHGVTQEVIQTAYKAAAAAWKDQLAMGQKPFLVSGSKGPVFSGGVLEVHTQPLGYQRSISTEEDARNLVRSCLRAVRVLHAAGVVHTDLRLANTVWLDEKHCMVIDLEFCRSAKKQLPNDVPYLVSWDDGLVLEERGGGRYYTPTSDLYQIGRMLEQVQEERPQLQSELASDFVRLLKGRKSAADPSKHLTAEEALEHAWLHEEEQNTDSGDAEGDEGRSGGGARERNRKRGSPPPRAAAAAGNGPEEGKRRKGKAAGQVEETGDKASSRKGAQA